MVVDICYSHIPQSSSMCYIYFDQPKLSNYKVACTLATSKMIKWNDTNIPTCLFDNTTNQLSCIIYSLLHMPRYAQALANIIGVKFRDIFFHGGR